jgi:HSP20 family protein
VSSRSSRRSGGEATGLGVILHNGVTLLDVANDAPYRPPADVGESRDAVTVRVELPGVAPKDLVVAVRDFRIEVSGEKRCDAATPAPSYLCMERSFGRFSRVFEVTGSVNLQEMTAVYRQGVLELRVPKVAERRGRERRIRIEREGEE